jgi:hypothetical protein
MTRCAHACWATCMLAGGNNEQHTSQLPASVGVVTPCQLACTSILHVHNMLAIKFHHRYAPSPSKAHQCQAYLCCFVQVMMATGRVPKIQNLGLADVGVQLGEFWQEPIAACLLGTAGAEADLQGW